MLDQQKTLQHPEGFEDITNPENLEKLGKAMKEKNINRIVHFEGQSLWIHSKLAIMLVEFMNIPEEKKNDLKLLMLYHDLGKTIPGMNDWPEIKEIAEKELSKGKLYQVAKGHAGERLSNTKAGFRANGISGRKLEVFMTVVENHMNHLRDMGPKELVKLFEGFGRTDEERKPVAELLALAQQTDSNATAYADLTEDGEITSLKKENTVGLDFDKIWRKYLEAKK